MFTLLKSTLQAGDEDSPELTDENKDIEVAETLLQMERSRLASPFPFDVDAADLYNECKHCVIAFDLYALATELTKNDDPIQRLTLLLVKPDGHETLNETKEALENYFTPKRNVVSERYKFRSRGQRPDETIDTYLIALRELSLHEAIRFHQSGIVGGSRE